jgi:hypothetical protein
MKSKKPTMMLAIIATPISIRVIITTLGEIHIRARRKGLTALWQWKQCGS